jgi:hypothetical protein
VEINLTTPALLFPAISLLLLAYTNRFLAVASLIRNLHTQYRDSHEESLRGQIDNLRRRIYLIRNMQAAGVLSLLLCVLCMFLLFAGVVMAGKIVFGVSLLCMIISLGISLQEISISVYALDLQLRTLEDSPPGK